MVATALDVVRVSALDPVRLSQLRAALASDREAREALIATHAEVVAEFTGQVDSDSMLERELAEAAIARASDAIDDIDAALARMDTGTYGLCDSCMAQIPLERLEAIPHARVCVRCSGKKLSVLR
jgi:RNA polymerase-binding transcription factor DksA